MKLDHHTQRNSSSSDSESHSGSSDHEPKPKRRHRTKKPKVKDPNDTTDSSEDVDNTDTLHHTDNKDKNNEDNVHNVHTLVTTIKRAKTIKPTIAPAIAAARPPSHEPPTVSTANITSIPGLEAYWSTLQAHPEVLNFFHNLRSVQQVVNTVGILQDMLIYIQEKVQGTVKPSNIVNTKIKNKKDNSLLIPIDSLIISFVNASFENSTNMVRKYISLLSHVNYSHSLSTHDFRVLQQMTFPSSS
jgi:hypothetical protein